MLLLGVSHAPAVYAPVSESHIQVVRRACVGSFATRQAPSTSISQVEQRVSELEAEVKELKDFKAKLLEGFKESKEILDDYEKQAETIGSTRVLLLGVCLAALLFSISKGCEKNGFFSYFVMNSDVKASNLRKSKTKQFEFAAETIM